MADQLARWVDELAAALGVDPAAVDRDAVLDLARDAAHGVARPAAPLTTFLVGLALGQRGLTVAEATRVVKRLADSWDD